MRVAVATTPSRTITPAWRTDCSQDLDPEPSQPNMSFNPDVARGVGNCTHPDLVASRKSRVMGLSIPSHARECRLVHVWQASIGLMSMSEVVPYWTINCSRSVSFITTGVNQFYVPYDRNSTELNSSYISQLSPLPQPAQGELDSTNRFVATSAAAFCCLGV